MEASLELRAFHHATGNAVILPYDRIAADPRGAIREIAAYLELPVSGAEIERIDTADQRNALERAVLPFPSSRRHPDGRTYREHYVEQLAVATA